MVITASSIISKLNDEEIDLLNTILKCDPNHNK